MRRLMRTTLDTLREVTYTPLMNKSPALPAVGTPLPAFAKDRPLPKFTSVGCYPIVYVTGDMDCLCATCATKMRDEAEDGAAPLACDIHWEGEALSCDDCGDDIESAYGVPE
jgi:hypothetical protein